MSVTKSTVHRDGIHFFKLRCIHGLGSIANLVGANEGNLEDVAISRKCSKRRNNGAASRARPIVGRELNAREGAKELTILIGRRGGHCRMSSKTGVYGVTGLDRKIVDTYQRPKGATFK